MKKFAIVTRLDAESEQIKKNVEKQLVHNGFTQCEQPELVLAIGGDGTVLEAFRKYGPTAHYVGLHTGTLGFYADWQKDEIELLIEQMITNATPEIVSYPLVEFVFRHMDGTTTTCLALNEGIIKSSTLSTFVLDVAINGELFEAFRGDGLIISTPSGSTAYNYSVLGSVLHPSIEAVQVAELAAINNGVFRTLNRSFVLPKHHTLTLKIGNPVNEVLIGIDGVEYSFSTLDSIQAKVADQKIKFIRYRPFPFWERVKDKFLQ